jgi:hypothetical protein
MYYIAKFTNKFTVRDGLHYKVQPSGKISFSNLILQDILQFFCLEIKKRKIIVIKRNFLGLTFSMGL